MDIRIAVAADVDAIARLINDAFRIAESFLIERDRTSPDKVRAMLDKGVFLLAQDEAKGGLGGCVYVEIRRSHGYFGLLAVDPARQRNGLGQLLVAAAEDYAREAGCRFMDLRVVNLRAELPRFYERLGYAVTGTEPFSADAKPKRACHFVNMSKPLR